MTAEKLRDINIAVTSRCNSNCIHCSYKKKKIPEPRELSTQKIKKMLSEAKNFGARNLDLTGGEPLLRENIEEIVRSSKELGYKVKILTNGYLLSQEKIKRLIDAGLDAVGISLDSLTPEAYTRVRGVGKEFFKCVLENIEIAVRSQLYAKLNTVGFKSNLEEIVDIFNFCLQVGVEEHRICYLSPIGKGKHCKELVDPLEWLGFIKSLSNKNHLFVSTPIIEKERTIESECRLNMYKPLLVTNKGFYPCNLSDRPYRSLIDVLNIPQTEIEKQRETCEKIHRLTQTLKQGYKFVCPLRKFSIEELKS